jgi:hypothetical protein
MKTKRCFSFSFAIILSMLLFAEISFTQTNTFPSTGAAGIGTTTPDSSSLLEIRSKTKGILIPRMTKNQRDAIVSPAIGLMIYQTNSTSGFYYYSGSAWTAVSPKGTSKTLNNLTAPTAVNVDLLPGGSNSIDLGSSLLNWRNIYAAGSYYIGTFKVVDAGTSNTFIGVTTNTTNTGSNNTAVGASALRFNTSGGYNTATGAFALYSNTTTNNNTAYGYGALYTNSSGTNNTATGAFSLAYNSSGSGNTAIGNFALNHNNIGTSNTASGNNALFNNTDGSNCTATGADALYNNTTGYLNTAIGSAALNVNTSGFYNTAIGGNALKNNTGVVNTATGVYTLYSNTSGAYNSAHGASALANNTTGQDNTADGANALAHNTTGNYNTAVGYNALTSDTTGDRNTAIGYYADVSSGGLINATAIGNEAVVNTSNKIRLGNGAVSVIEGNSVYTVSDARFKKNVTEDVKGLAFINELRPVVYNFEAKKFDEFLHRSNPENFQKNSSNIDYSAAEQSRKSGFIAQEVDKAAKKTAYDFDGVHVPQNDGDNYSLAYAQFVVPLVKAVQELSSQNSELKIKNIEQQKINQDLQERLAKLESILNVKSTTNYKLQTTNLFSASLEQNIPNPFNHTTTINYTLPQQFSSAKIIITDKAGKILKETNLSGSGKGSVTVDASMLSSGAYQYALYVNQKMIDTKQMVHAK